MNWREHIDVGTEPKLKRLGLSVEGVLATLGTGASIEAVLSRVPGLTHEDVAACIAFAADAIHRTRFVESIRKGLDDTAAGRLTDDEELWDALDRAKSGK